MNGELVLVDEIEDDIFEYELNPSSYDFSLVIYVDNNKSLNDQLNNNDKFLKCVNYMRKIGEHEFNFYDEEEDNIDYIYNNLPNILNDVEYIRFSFNKTNVIKYLKENPMLLNKKIVLSEIIDITDYDKLIKLMYEYNEIKDKVYISMVDNTNYVSLNDCYRTMSEIKRQADKIKKLNLSPMETIMYVYDQVRNRVYMHEDNTESLFKSRDLSEVMFGDKIVCAGYANMFHTLLTYLGIKSNVVRLIDKNDESGRTGHARNLIYVQDDKYNIDGVYYFDATWDSKRRDNDNSYLYHYNNFAKTRNQMDSNERYNFEDTNFNVYSNDIYDKVKEIIDTKNYDELEYYFKSINYMSSIVNGQILLQALNIVPVSPLYGCFDKDEFLRKFKEISDKFNKELDAETYIKLLNNVRKVEYYEDSNWYFYSLNDLYKTSIISNWKFSGDYIDQGVKTLLTIFGTDLDEKTKYRDNFKNYTDDIGLITDISHVRLTKVLQKSLNK